jgi:predicted nuclease of predicted toxin-antitoxin system
MKLLFDQHLSRWLVDRLADEYSLSSHVALIGIQRDPDEVVWNYAKFHDFVVVTKDSDLAELGYVHGFPPKVIWLRIGNCTTDEVEAAIRASRDAIVAFGLDPDASVLEILPCEPQGE